MIHVCGHVVQSMKHTEKTVRRGKTERNSAWCPASTRSGSTILLIVSAAQPPGFTPPRNFCLQPFCADESSGRSVAMTAQHIPFLLDIMLHSVYYGVIQISVAPGEKVWILTLVTGKVIATESMRPIFTPPDSHTFHQWPDECFGRAQAFSRYPLSFLILVFITEVTEISFPLLTNTCGTLETWTWKSRELPL